MCDAIPCSVISFLGWNAGTSFQYQLQCWTGSYNPQQHVVKATVMTHPCVSFCVHTYGSRDPRGNKLSIVPKLSSPACHGVLCQAVLWFGSLWWVHQLSAFSVQLWHLLVNHSMADQWCLCFYLWSVHPPSDIDGTYAGISVHTTKPPINVCSWPGVQSLHISKQYVTYSHFVIEECGNTRSAYLPD